MYNLWKNHAIPVLRVSQQSVPEIYRCGILPSQDHPNMEGKGREGGEGEGRRGGQVAVRI